MNNVNEMPVPTLVFGEALEEDKLPVNMESKAAVQEKLDDSILSEEERRMVDEFSKQIDLHNSNAILQFGVGTQKKMADFSGDALENVRTKDLGEIGEMLSGVVAELKDFDAEEAKGVFGLFKKTSNKLDAMKIKYSKAETNIVKICQALEQQQVQLLKDIAVLDKMYDLNLTYFKELSMYILAGKKKLQDTRETELPALVEKARMSGLPEDAQAAKDLEGLCDRFEKEDPRSGADKNGFDPDGAADQACTEQRYDDGGKDPVYGSKYNPAMEEPDGAGAWRKSCGAGGKGAAGSFRYDQRAFA